MSVIQLDIPLDILERQQKLGLSQCLQMPTPQVSPYLSLAASNYITVIWLQTLPLTTPQLPRVAAFRKIIRSLGNQTTGMLLALYTAPPWLHPGEEWGGLI